VLCAASLAVAVEAARAASPGAATERDRPIAELCLVPAAQLMDVSASVLTDLDTDAQHWAYGTAHGLLARAGVRRGDKVLITDASSSIGMAAVRLAQLRGARVTGQCRAEKVEAVLAAGAVATLTREGDLTANSFAVIIDVTGGTGWRARIDALRPGGRYAALGALGGTMVEGCLHSVYLNDLTLFGRISQPREVFSGLVTLVTCGGLAAAPSTKSYPKRPISKVAPTAARIPPGNLHRAFNERQDNG
jgi:alcohol dehydrogenase